MHATMQASLRERSRDVLDLDGIANNTQPLSDYGFAYCSTFEPCLFLMSFLL